ncbi:hypothetical protein [Wielerella bovis]|uniref:hypothetical protein n=1 Tax=Wielerella bovis TaxID=2917790 RepID=UPI002018F3A4|nr:hypothetical protein [Wielerella bovis]ULJ66203.1 hypothetical protein MIS31_07955 [Wielerella bovis]
MSKHSVEPKILAYLQEHGAATAAQIAVDLKLDKRLVISKLIGLRKVRCVVKFVRSSSNEQQHLWQLEAEHCAESLEQHLNKRINKRISKPKKQDILVGKSWS